MVQDPASPKVPPELETAAEQVGDFIQYWGFKKVHGRIWAHLYLSDHPMDAAELMRRLQISKALVSISVADLMKYDVIREAGKSPQGTQLYQANPAIVSVIVNVLRQRERRMFAQIGASFALLGKLKPSERQASGIDEERLNSVCELVRIAETSLDSLIELDPFDLEQIKEAPGLAAEAAALSSPWSR